MKAFNPKTLNSNKSLSGYLDTQFSKNLKYSKGKLSPKAHKHPKIHKTRKKTLAVFKIIFYASYGNLLTSFRHATPKKWRLYRLFKIESSSNLLKMHNTALKHFSKAKEPLVPCRNIYSPSAKGIGLMKDLESAPKETAPLFSESTTIRGGKFSLFETRGFCRGSVLWFERLFSSLKNEKGQKASDKELLIATAKNFKKGIPPGGVLHHFLKLDETSTFSQSAFLFWTHEPERLIFDQLPKGQPLALETPHHSLFVYKTKTSLFLFDSEMGLLEYPATENGKKAFRSYLRQNYHCQKEDLFNRLKRDWDCDNPFDSEPFNVLLGKRPFPELEKEPSLFYKCCQTGQLTKEEKEKIKNLKLEQPFKDYLEASLKGTPIPASFKNLKNEEKEFLQSLLGCFYKYAPYHYAFFR